MATLAVLGTSTVAQIRARPEDLNNVQLLAHGPTVDHLLAQLAGARWTRC
jgi:hypothetical protein